MGRAFEIRPEITTAGGDAAYFATRHSNAERQLRTVAVGRKNWLFPGSFEGARRAALLYSLIQSCRLIDLPPFPYLRDVLVRIATHPHQRVHELAPRGWKAAFGAGSLA